MKKLIFAIALATTVITGAFAQKGAPDGDRKGFDPEKMAEKRSERLKADLKLTDQQFAAVTKLHKENLAKREAERKEMQAKHEAQKLVFKSEMKKILTPEQFKTFEEKMAANEARRKEGMKGRNHGGHHHGGHRENKG